MTSPHVIRRLPLQYLLASLLLIASTAKTHALAATYCVSPNGQSPTGQYPDGRSSCYTTIHDALAVASDVDTVLVYSGTYKEAVVLTHATSLIAADGAQVVIDASGQPNGIFVDGRSKAPQPGVGRLVVREMRVLNAQFEGILIINATDVTLLGNEVRHNDLALDGNNTCPGMPEFETDEASDCGGGIHLIAVDHSSVTHNKVFDNAGGILVTDETGPSSFNFIAENNVHENPYGSGIALASNAPANSVAPSATVTFGVNDNIVAHNNSWSNGTQASTIGAGIGLFAPAAISRVNANVVMDNDVSANGKGGVVVETKDLFVGPANNTNDNRIIGNNISNNGADPVNPASLGNSTGISVSAVGVITGTMILANKFDDETADVAFGSLQPYTFIHLNNFAPPWGMVAVLGVPENSANWWNCASGPVTWSGQNTPSGGPCAVDVNRLPDLTAYPWLTHPFGYRYDHKDDHDGDQDK